MQTRSQAVKTALNPPQVILDWDKVPKWNAIEEFTLLQDTGSALVGARWSDPEVQETMKTYQHIKCAYEEIQ